MSSEKRVRILVMQGLEDSRLAKDPAFTLAYHRFLLGETVCIYFLTYYLCIIVGDILNLF
jgi:hypothetical protein